MTVAAAALPGLEAATLGMVAVTVGRIGMVVDLQAEVREVAVRVAAELEDGLLATARQTEPQIARRQTARAVEAKDRVGGAVAVSLPTDVEKVARVQAGEVGAANLLMSVAREHPAAVQVEQGGVLVTLGASEVAAEQVRAEEQILAVAIRAEARIMVEHARMSGEKEPVAE